jgi:hypothetical protein
MQNSIIHVLGFHNILGLNIWKDRRFYRVHYVNFINIHTNQVQSFLHIYILRKLCYHGMNCLIIHVNKRTVYYSLRVCLTAT